MLTSQNLFDVAFVRVGYTPWGPRLTSWKPVSKYLRVCVIRATTSLRSKTDRGRLLVVSYQLCGIMRQGNR